MATKIDLINAQFIWARVEEGRGIFLKKLGDSSKKKGGLQMRLTNKFNKAMIAKKAMRILF